ncbi:MAG: hypothetical protein ACM65M_08820 [Microcoleus sp.]
MKVIWGFCLVLVVLLWGGDASAGVLADRLSSFPNWGLLNNRSLSGDRECSIYLSRVKYEFFLPHSE